MLLYNYLQKTYAITRRDFSQMLQEQVISVNEITIESYKHEINIGDKIKISLPDWREILNEMKFYPWMSPKIVLFNKPKWYVCSKDDPHNKTIYEILPKSWHKDFRYVGRLDKESTWLLLLTNDSNYVDYYENPFNDIHKVYEVEINKPLRSNDVKKMRRGLTVDSNWNLNEDSKKNLENDFLKCVWVRYQKINERHFVIITLNEGKNRHIRRLLKALGYHIKSLHRLKIGKRHIQGIKPGKRKIEKARKLNMRKKPKTIHVDVD